MKKIVPFFLVASFCFLACSKKNGDALSEMTVREFKTNIPLQAKVEFYDCDLGWGSCSGQFLTSSGYSDVNGIYRYTADQLKQAKLKVSTTKDRYWEGLGVGNVYLSPEGWLNLHIKTIYNYATKNYFVIQANGENQTSELLCVKAPIDSVIKVRVFGSGHNTLSWFVTTNNISDCYYCLVDTLKSGTFKMDVLKWETKSMDLDY